MEAPVTRRRVTKNRRIRPILAWRSLRQMFADPDDTAQVFIFLNAMGGKHFDELFEKVASDSTGAKVLERKPDALRQTLQDRALLAKMPEGSLGRHYLDFVKSEKLTADGLVEASEEAPHRVEFNDPRAETLSTRLRDMHDLWHVVTGYGRDLVGEDALLAFTASQTRNRGIRLIVLAATIKSRLDGYAWVRGVVRTARKHGRQAGLLPAQDWEAMLPRPLDDIRRELGVQPAPTYIPVWTVPGGSAYPTKSADSPSPQTNQLH